MLLPFVSGNLAQDHKHDKFLHITLLNARSVCNKLPELHHLLYYENWQVVVITETWLNSNIPDGLLDPSHRYHIFRCDRNVRRGGGVCVLVNRELNAVNVDISECHSDVELLCIDIIRCKANCRLVAVYRSTDNTQQSDKFTKQLVQCIESVCCVSWPCFVVGDFNAPTIDWSHLSVSSSGADIHVLLIMDLHKLSTLPLATAVFWISY